MTLYILYMWRRRIWWFNYTLLANYIMEYSAKVSRLY